MMLELDRPPLRRSLGEEVERAEGERLVGHFDVQGVPVWFGVDRNRDVTRVTARTDDTDRDLTTVGDEHLVHGEGLSEIRDEPGFGDY